MGIAVYLCIGLTYALVHFHHVTQWPDAHITGMDRGISALSPKHLRVFQEAKTGPFIQTVKALQNDPEKLEAWRNEMDEMLGEYLHDNVVRHEYLLIRAVKV